MSKGKGPYPYQCPDCGKQVEANAKWVARNRLACLPCTRIRNHWYCLTCGVTDPTHPFPCPKSS